MARFFHISDVHVSAARPGWTTRELLSKHATGWVNWTILRRRRRFANSRHVLGRFVERVRVERPDAVIFSGDATAMGFSREAVEAARLLHVNEITGLAVPGNHDHYTSVAVNGRGFECAFKPWLDGIRVTEDTYPFARNIAGVWFIGVNSCVPNLGVWDARGQVGAMQLNRLDQLLAELPHGPRVLVTHYPLVTADGTPEPQYHGLRDRIELAAIAAKYGIQIWLCGHRHYYYRFGPSKDTPFQIVCAGSSTMVGTAGYWEIEIDSAGTVSCERRPLDC